MGNSHQSQIDYTIGNSYQNQIGYTIGNSRQSQTPSPFETTEMRFDVSGSVEPVNSNTFSWDIHDADFMQKETGVRSPPFSYKGCSWNIEAFPCEKEVVIAFLSRMQEDEGPDFIRVSYAFGFRPDNIEAEEHPPNLNRTFRKGTAGRNGCPRSAGKPYNERCDETHDVGDPQTITISCRFLEEDVAPLVKLAKLEALSSDFEKLLRDQIKSDVVLKVRGTEFPAHKAVLAVRAPWILFTFSNDYETRVVTIPDCDPVSFPLFLSFLYSGRIGELTLNTALQLYETSDKYNVQDLKSICTNHLIHNLTPESVCDIAVFAQRHFDPDLEHAAQLCFNENYISILQTLKWKAMFEAVPPVCEKLLKEMASAAKKEPTK